MADQWVMNSQHWLNQTFAGVSGYNPVQETGNTGWNTMYALTRALQHELGITALSDNFGATTLSRLTSQFPAISATTQNSNPRVAGIIQCALWCKGYSGGGTFGTWDGVVSSSVSTVNSDMGLGTASSLSPKAVKSLLTMDAYVVVNGGSPDVRTVQQWMNGTYRSRQDFYVMPCDGHYSRDVQRGLLYAIQYELGMADGTANGNFGPGTQSGLQSQGVFGQGVSDGSHHLVRLFQGALRFNGYSPPFNGSFDAVTASETSNFQEFVRLPDTSSANFPTWASLLVSTGDPNRSATAADASTPLTTSTATGLHSAGYRTIGRYLNGTTKRIAPGEFDVIFNAGLTVYPIYQEYNNAAQYFDDAQGYAQGVAAVRRARQLGMKAGTTIYFPVDYDPTDDEISAVVLPYFNGVKRGVQTSTSVAFQVGVYGTRNVCGRVSAQGLAVSSFIAGMSTGWSGNLGFTLPENWAYDQIQNLTISGLEIDKDVKSPFALPSDSSDVLDTPIDFVGSAPAFDDFFWWITELTHLAETAVGSNLLLSNTDVYELVLHQLQVSHLPTPNYDDLSWRAYTPEPEAISTNAFFSAAMAQSRADFEATATPQPTTATYQGQIDHWAASARAYLNYGAYTGSDSTQVGDLGSWALDLVTCWGDYAAARNAGTYMTGARSWMHEHIGTTTPSKFGLVDLISDVDAYIVEHQRNADPARPLSDIVREILVECAADPRWRYQQFLAWRFGSRTALESAARDALRSPSPWISIPVWAKYGGRLPGDPGVEGVDPDGAELASELDETVIGFADRIMAFVNDSAPNA